MPGKTIKVRASGGGEFDCYLGTPAGGGKVPAVVLASAVHDALSMLGALR